MSELDREHQERRAAQEKEWDEHYSQYREHKRKRFHTEFEDWRSQQHTTAAGSGDEGRNDLMGQGSSGGSAGGNIGGGADTEQERDKSLSSPGGSLGTDRTGVGALSPPETATGGGAGMKGAGAVGGSSATMAAKTAGPGAPNPSSGASDSGVTTGSENKTN